MTNESNAVLASRIADLTRQNSELMAQVEQLRQLGAELINNCGGLTVNADTWKAASLAFGDVDYQDSANNLAAAIIKKPAHRLTET